MKALIKAKRINQFSTIGIIAPGSPISNNSNFINEGYKKLSDRGFVIKEAEQCRKIYGHTAGTIQERVDAIHGLLLDPAVDLLMSFWGGYQSHQLLEYLDYDLIQQNPKPIIGYSDVTALLVGIYAKTNLVTYTGPAVISFCKPVTPEYTWHYFINILKDTKPESIIYEKSPEFSDNAWYDHPDKKMIFNKTPDWLTYNKGKAKGHIIAGNLGTLLLLNNTEYWPNLNGAILIIEEDEEESPETVDRLFTQLRQIGVFNQISGLAIGRFPGQVKFNSKDEFDDILSRVLQGYDFPVLLNVNYGHTDPIMTLPIGIQAEINADEKKITILEQPVLCVK